MNKIFLIENEQDAWDYVAGVVVVAASEHEARALVAKGIWQNSQSERFLNPELTTIREIGQANDDVVEGVILEDKVVG